MLIPTRFPLCLRPSARGGDIKKTASLCDTAFWCVTWEGLEPSTQ